MSAASDYLENKIYNAILRATPLAPPSKVFIALHTSSPGDTGANEVTAAEFPGYRRQDAAKGNADASTGWTAPNNGSGKNALQLIFPVFDGAAPITVTHYTLWDAATDGNCLIMGQFAASRTLGVGDVFVIDVQKITVSVL